jgi:hypothetical protein
MLSLEQGKPIAISGRKLVYLDSTEDGSESEEPLGEIISKNKMVPLLDTQDRNVTYIAGPSGSGKTYFAVMLIKRFLKATRMPFYLFSRTDYKNDPAFEGMDVNQIMIDESLVEDPMDIETELSGGCLVFFDDCGTIQNDKVKKAVDKIMADIMEVGRKMRIWVVITNHLVVPNDKKMARTILNEMHSLTVFPKSGSVQQISYILKQYFGFNKEQINKIVQLNSRWVMINKHYPMYVTYEHGIYLV